MKAGSEMSRADERWEEERDGGGWRLLPNGERMG